MKMEEMMMSKNKELSSVHYCKKCGCELVSTNKHKLCDNCRRECRDNIKKGMGGLVGIGGIAVTVLPFIVKRGKHGE